MQHEHISQKKETFPILPPLLTYLQKYDRKLSQPVRYADLERFDNAVTLYDKHGKDSLWITALYSGYESQMLFDGLKNIYSILKSGGDKRVHEHLHIERVDYCTFGNSNPFRIKIVNNYNDVYDYFYIKKPDTSRVFGLELEHILSPSRINFFADENALVEEHIAGIPGDIFIEHYLDNPDFNRKRIAKEFVKFNERCFVRLLGDMRSYNYVFDITPDFEEVQFRIRAIDFDQQSYEGRKNLYMPQFFKENRRFVELAQKHFNQEVIEQYQREEQTLIYRRIIGSKNRLQELFAALQDYPLSLPEKIAQLKREVSAHFEADISYAHTMPEIVKAMLNIILKKHGNETEIQ